MQRLMPLAGQVAKGTVISIVLSLLAIIIMALLVKFAGPSDSVILVANQIVKFGSIFLGTLAAVGRGGEKGFFKGALVGALYMALGIAAYALASQSGAPAILVLTDVGLGAGAGAISGAIAANLKISK